MSTKVADSFVSEQTALFLQRDGWQNWTPTVSQGGAVAATVNFARYEVKGQTVRVRGQLAVTGAGVAGNAVTIGGLPGALSPVQAGGIVGVIDILDAGTAQYAGVLFVASATTFVGQAHNLTGRIGVTPNFALANGDFIYFQGEWER